jgi:hypothetical protein
MYLLFLHCLPLLALGFLILLFAPGLVYLVVEVVVFKLEESSISRVLNSIPIGESIDRGLQIN